MTQSLKRASSPPSGRPSSRTVADRRSSSGSPSSVRALTSMTSMPDLPRSAYAGASRDRLPTLHVYVVTAPDARSSWHHPRTERALVLSPAVHLLCSTSQAAPPEGGPTRAVTTESSVTEPSRAPRVGCWGRWCAMVKREHRPRAGARLGVGRSSADRWPARIGWPSGRSEQPRERSRGRAQCLPRGGTLRSTPDRVGLGVSGGGRVPGVPTTAAPSRHAPSGLVRLDASPHPSQRRGPLAINDGSGDDRQVRRGRRRRR
jgi:hypothetical protein